MSVSTGQGQVSPDVYVRAIEELFATRAFSELPITVLQDVIDLLTVAAVEAQEEDQ